MKKLLLIVLASAALLQASTARDWIDRMVADIQPNRSGLQTAALKQIKNPFVLVKKVSKKGTKTTRRGYTGKKKYKKAYGSKITLMATLNNSAKINNKWYKLHAKVSGYTLNKITKSYVILKKNKKTSIIVHLKKYKNRLTMTKK